jgi:hypothetical protein
MAAGGKVLREITPEITAGIFRLCPLPAVASQTTPIFGSDCGGGGACLRLLIPRTAPPSCIFWPYAHLVRTRFYHAFYPHKWYCAMWLIWTTFSASSSLSFSRREPASFLRGRNRRVNGATERRRQAATLRMINSHEAAGAGAGAAEGSCFLARFHLLERALPSFREKKFQHFLSHLWPTQAHF